MSIYIFCEGKTEMNIVIKLTNKFIKLANPEFEGKGKSQVNKLMVKTIGPLLSQRKAVRVLIMRDVDKGETPQSILQSVTNAVQKMLRERDFSATAKAIKFQSHQNHPNVYLLTLTEPDFCLAVHLATYKWSESFGNATIDDYVLDLALRETTTESLLRKKKWSIQPTQVIRKVTDRIPALLQENDIPLREAKDYIRLYVAVIQEEILPPAFAGSVTAKATDADKAEIFAPLLAALNFLGGTHEQL